MESVSFSRLKLISSSFLRELKQTYKNERTSLGFIVHKLSPTPLIKEGENFEVLVVGGSVMKKALIKKTKRGINVLKVENEKNIYFNNGNDFLDLVAKELYSDVKTLALDFAYPLQPIFENGKLDGIFLGSTKGVKLHSLIGKRIGKTIEDHVLKKVKKKIKVSVANDTVCLMLSGLSKFRWQNLAAGIVGTGLNFALFTNKNHLVNLESASFNKFTQTKEGKIVDRASDKPGKSLFEKETAGGYLYKHFNITLKEKNLSFSPIKSTKELNRVSLSNIKNASHIAKDLIKRSAQFVACQVAGITLFKKQNMVFVMEGSLFWKGSNYKKIVEKTVRQLVPKYKIHFAEIGNSSIVGAAKLIS